MKEESDPLVDMSATCLQSQNDAMSQPTRAWLDIGILPFDGRAATFFYLVENILLDIIWLRGI